MQILLHLINLLSFINCNPAVPCCSCWELGVVGSSQPVLCCDCHTGIEEMFVTPPPLNVPEGNTSCDSLVVPLNMGGRTDTIRDSIENFDEVQKAYINLLS